RADAVEDALRVWGKLPKANLEWRPDIAAMLGGTRHTIGLRTDDHPDLEQLPVPGGAARETTDIVAPAAMDDPNATRRAKLPFRPGDPAPGTWSGMPAPESVESVPSQVQWRPNGQHGVYADPQEDLVPQQSAPLWTPAAYADWTSSAGGSLSTPPDMASEPHPVGVPTSASSP